MLKKGLYLGMAICLSVSSISCASIVSGRSQHIPVITNPSGAIITVGTMKQVSPATFILDRRQEVYMVKVEKEGYESVEVTLKKGVNGWVFGNIIFGGIIGLVIDIASGSASKFTPDEVEVNLVTKSLSHKDLKDKDILFVKLVDSSRSRTD